MADENADKVVEKLKAALKDLWPAADAPADTEKPSVPAEAERMASRARKKYDGTLRWILGVFSAVGLLIFGSVPFADLEHVDPTLLVLGLALAGVGLGIVIWATTTGLEMQDASLGELSRTFKDREGKATNWWLFPRGKASNELKKVLEDSQEATAHLGPGLGTVTQLIQRLGTLERAAMRARLGWDGGKKRSTDRRPDDENGQVAGSTAVRLARAKTAKDELKALESALAELRKQKEEEPGDQDIADALSALQLTYRAIAVALPDDTMLTAGAMASTYDELLKVYLDHRELVLDESLVAQMRGTFRVVRRWLMLGAAFVLAGGTTFAYAVANPTDADPKAAVTVTLKSDKAPWNGLKECSGVEDDKDLVVDGLLSRSDDGDGAQDGPFSFVVIEGDCAGTDVDVEEGEGSYATADGSSPVEPAPADAERPTKVSFTLEANTAAWRGLDDCRPEGGQDMTRLQGLMYTSDDADGQRDGPFEVLITRGPCAGQRVQVDDGNGTYRRRGSAVSASRVS